MAGKTPISEPRHTLYGTTGLICIGAAKTATSWLHHWLGGLPEVTVSPLKEVHFFNARFPENALWDVDAMALERLRFHLSQPGDAVRNLRDWPTFRASLDRVQMIYDETAYLAHFARLARPETRVFADFTPAYAVIGAAGFRLAQALLEPHNISPRILFLMRDPVSRLWSQLRHWQQMRADFYAGTDWQTALDSPAIMARCDYRSTIETLEAVFRPEERLFLFYEDLFTETAQKRLCRFIGSTYAAPESHAARNETDVKTPLPDVARAAFLDRLVPQYAYCRQKFGDAVPGAWLA
ncbi:Sulfotransferase family protein [Roseivivax lentus]|uniref:Sulfotransferase family protein n=1 Tax=Roseivivax lentus TaxID=633194 RepID=A0A1N7PP89_9RHOB|nr:sulfotransferase [Roseivivax lentus]SIT12464.1 Sulfotransferase family protein [Roseivivax lentus]